VRTTYAYYSRAGSFSRSYNAEVAEEEGRLPRTRAAKRFGLSAAAFDAGCEAAEYQPCEWHHVGRYAVAVDYYDCETLAADPRFWEGAAAAYKSAARRAMVKARQAAFAAENVAAEKEAHAQWLIKQRARLHAQWTSPIPKLVQPPERQHRAWLRWLEIVRQAFIDGGCPYRENETPGAVTRGDFATLATRVIARKERLASPPAMTPKLWDKRVRKALAEAGHAYPKRQTIPQVSIGDEAALAAMIARKCAGKKAK